MPHACHDAGEAPALPFAGKARRPLTTGFALSLSLALTAALGLAGCASAPEGDSIADQMRSGGACAPATPAKSATTATASGATPILPAAQAPAHHGQTSPYPKPAHAVARPRIDLQGQMSVKLAAFADQPAKGLSLGFFFSGNTDKGQLDLMTLMGSQMAQVNWQPGEAWLTNDKGKGRYDDIDALSQAALGEALPLRQLVYWMQGTPDPDLPSVPGPEPDTFLQQGWLIDAHELQVKKLSARREATPQRRAVQIKVYLDR